VNLNVDSRDLPLDVEGVYKAASQTTEPLQTSDEAAPASVTIPIHGDRVNIYDSAYNQVSTSSAVIISDHSILSLTELSTELEICWYLDNEVQKCAYRRYGGDWIQFLAEDSGYRDGFGAKLYDNLFGHSGFCIVAPRGAAYYAQDYYYFDVDGVLRFLFCGTFLDVFVDFNNDGVNELIWFYHGGRDAAYYYPVGDDFFVFDIIGAISACFADWEYLEINPLSLCDDTLELTYQRGDEQYDAQIRFTADNLIVQEKSTSRENTEKRDIICAPVIKSIELSDTDGNPLVVDDWIWLKAESIITVAYEGNATRVDFYTVPTGTETVLEQKLIGMVGVAEDDRTAQLKWEVPDNFMGYIWVMVYNGDIARTSDTGYFFIKAIFEQ